MAILQNQYPYTDFQKINLDWVLDLCNKLKSDAENGVFNGERGYSVLGGENVRIISAIVDETTEPYCVSLAQIPNAQVGDFVIGKYQNVLSIMLITRTDISGTLFIGDSVTSLVGPQGPQGEQGEPGEGGLTEAMKQAFLQLARKVAYIDGNGQTYYTDLYNSFYPPAGLVSISAVFAQGSNIIYDTDNLSVLRQYLTVTAHYDNSTSAVVTTYTLSGTLTAGNSTITVAYGGESTTFVVAVTHYEEPETRTLLYNWDFTNSLTDTVGGLVATLSGSNVTQSANGLEFTNAANCALGAIYGVNRTYEIDIADFPVSKIGTNGRLFMFTSSYSATSFDCGVVCRGSTSKWEIYAQGWSAFGNVSLADVRGKTVSLSISSTVSSTKYTLYVDGVEVGHYDANFSPTNNNMILGSVDSNCFTGVVSALRVYEENGG